MAIILSNIKDVLSLASSVIQLGENCYHTSDALEKFKSDVAKLKRSHESWQRIARKYGLSSERTLCESLEEAMEQLRREEARLKRLDRGCGCLWLWLSSGTDFPTQLGKSIVNLDNAIPDNWKAHGAAEDAARQRAKDAARSPKFPFRRDGRYIRLPIIEEELKSILNNEGSGDEAVRVVLLYGRAGTGKSSMARSLALDYKEAANSEDGGYASNSTNGCSEFDDVLYVECGPQADSREKKVELLRLLQWESSYDTEQASNYSEKVPLMLEQLLKDRRSLLIFDDVWEESFLKDMVEVCGNHIRILVTSQKEYLCEESLIERTKSVFMDRLTKEEALRILKVHTGFCDEDDIPKAVKKCMDDILTRVQGHPHALASIAVAIDRSHRTQVRQWEDVTCEYDQLLNDSLYKHVRNPLHGVPYESSFSEAIEMKLKRVDQDGTKLLVLMAMFEGPSIPEEVIQLFYQETVAQNKTRSIRSSMNFSIARRKLKNLQCIKVAEYENNGTGEHEGLSWSIHSLDQQFIQSRMNNDIQVTLGVVQHLSDKIQGLKVEPQIDTTKLLGILSFKSDLGKKIEASLTEDLPVHLPIEKLLPVIRLMARNVCEDWDMISQKSCDQIFLSLTTEGVIHNDAAKNLLKSSTSKHQIWTLIRNVQGLIRERWSVNEDILVSLLQIFGDSELDMDDSDTISLNLEQCMALWHLVGGEVSGVSSCLLRMRKIVSGLVELLTSPCYQRNMKQFSALVLSYLVPLANGIPTEYGEEVLANTPMIIKELIDGCQEHNDSNNRSALLYPSWALCHLARVASSDVKQKMVSIGFHRFVDILGRGGNAQDFVLRILKHLLVDSSEIDLANENLGINTSMVQDLSKYLIGILTTGLFKQYRLVDAAQLLMRIEAARGENTIVHSSVEPLLRGSVLVELRQYANAVRDFEEARTLNPAGFYSAFDNFYYLIRARVQLKDWKGALMDFNQWMGQPERPGCHPYPFRYQERGVLKRLMGDLSGALEDLDKSLQLGSNDYEVLKQRGYVKFLMGDQEGAQADAKEALQLRSYECDEPGYQNNCLGTSIVKFLGFRL